MIYLYVKFESFLTKFLAYKVTVSLMEYAYILLTSIYPYIGY